MGASGTHRSRKVHLGASMVTCVTKAHVWSCSYSCSYSIVGSRTVDSEGQGTCNGRNIRLRYFARPIIPDAARQSEIPKRPPTDSVGVDERTSQTAHRSPEVRPVLPVAPRHRKVPEPSRAHSVSWRQPGTGAPGPESPEVAALRFRNAIIKPFAGVNPVFGLGDFLAARFLGLGETAPNASRHDGSPLPNS